MRLRKLKYLPLICTLLNLVTLGKTIYVPTEFTTIQAGINAAIDGDTVLVLPGYYTYEGNYNIDFSGKAIVVRSEAGAESTVLDARQCGRGFVFQADEGLNSVVEGFTILNGDPPGEAHGGGILCDHTSPTIKGNIISVCHGYYGGGICSIGGSPVIEANQISENTAERGGGIACLWGSQAYIVNNAITDNYSQGG